MINPLNMIFLYPYLIRGAFLKAEIIPDEPGQVMLPRDDGVNRSSDLLTTSDRSI